MDELIKDIKRDGDWTLEGKVFSKFFNRYIRFISENDNLEYVKTCAEYFNSFDDKLIDDLCRASIRYCNDFLSEVGEPEIHFQSIRDVLKIISPNFLVIPFPNDTNEPVLHMDLNCEWEIEHGMEWLVRGNEVLYVGQYSSVFAWDDYSEKDDWNYA
jgi:hypothetical protein